LESVCWLWIQNTLIGYPGHSTSLRILKSILVGKTNGNNTVGGEERKDDLKRI
jgi:hypothetical protein